MSEKYHSNRLLRAFFVLVLILLGTCSLSAQLLNEPRGLDPSRYAIYIEDVITGEILGDYNADIPLTPASITKAVTCAAVSTLFSPNSTFSTTVFADGEITPDSVLQGNIVIRSYGDPTIESARFESVDFCKRMAQACNESAIRTIAGKIVILTDDRVTEEAPSGWESTDLTKGYGAVYKACNFADNRFELEYPSCRSYPSIGDVNVEKGSKKGKFTISKSPYSNTFRTSGRVPRNAIRLSYPNSDPITTMRIECEKALISAGIEVVGNAEATTPGCSRLIYLHRSPDYAEIMRSLMVRSDNMLAEAMLRTLSPRGTRKDALEMERDVLGDESIDWTSVKIEDGSGLSRNNRFPAYFLADVLVQQATSGDGAFYASLFPKAGKEGTVRSFLAGTPLEGTLVLKSGSMSGVQCYAGYKIDDQGLPTHVIVIMVNGFTGDRENLRRELTSYLLNVFNVAEESYDDEKVLLLQ